MTDRVKIILEVDLFHPGYFGNPGTLMIPEYCAKMIENTFDYLNATATVVNERDTSDPLHPQHNEGEE